MTRFQGTYTALVTPFSQDGSVDRERFRSVLDLQAAARVAGVVIGGTTAESPTLSPEEFVALVTAARAHLPGRVEVIAGVGRNDLPAAERLTREARDAGVRAVMVVDPSYNAPSSLEIRREYLLPLARAAPDLDFLSYVVPARTGTCLSPVDLYLAQREAPNIRGVKDACGQDPYSREIRQRLPAPFSLLSGDDGRALSMVSDPEIRADGVVSVVANLAPGLVREAIQAAASGDLTTIARLGPTMARLSALVSFEVREATPAGPVALKVRNPLPVKAAFGLLGAGVGPCRPPLGRLGPAGFAQLYGALEAIDRSDPAVFAPLHQHLGGPASGLASIDEARSRWSYDDY